MKGILSIVAILLLGMSIYAQNNTVTLVEGRLMDTTDSSAVPYAHVWGKRGNTGTITDTAGYFRIYVHADDTLVFSAVGYGMQKRAIPVDAAHNHVTFWIDENSYGIDEVIVLPFSKERFKDEFVNLQLPPDKYAINLNLPKPPPYPHPSFSLKKPATIALSILTMTFKFNIYEMLPEKVAFKERWEQKQVDKWVTQEQYLERLSHKYNAQFVQSIVSVSDEQVEAFMKFCDLQPAFIDTATEYDIAFAIRECYLAWANVPVPNDSLPK